MKAIILLALVLVAVNSQDYTLWDNWNNVPSTWTSNAASSESSLSGWERNSPSNQHYSGQFSNFSKIYSQYMYWNSDDANLVIFCSPKYYIFNQTLCKKNPHFWSSAAAQYCLPNYFGSGEYNDGFPSFCGQDHPLYGTYECCYRNRVDSYPTFEKNWDSIDTYSPHLF